jgi:hypothetical protein
MVFSHKSISGKEATRMRDSNQGWFHQQVSFLRRQFLQDGDLPFNNVLSEEIVKQALTAINVFWMDRIYSPLVTLWVFLGQVLSADSCCRAAVARLIARRLSQGQGPCSPETGAYCQARKRLPEKFFSEVARQTGRALEANVDPQWLWKRRRVYVYDGSSVSMSDTPENQSAYPQPVVQKPGLGFPLARIAAVFSLACGAVLDLGICRYAGKGQSELGLLRTLWDLFVPGDVLLTDRLMCSWTGTGHAQKTWCRVGNPLEQAQSAIRPTHRRAAYRIAGCVPWPRGPRWRSAAAPFLPALVPQEMGSFPGGQHHQDLPQAVAVVDLGEAPASTPRQKLANALKAALVKRDETTSEGPG